MEKIIVGPTLRNLESIGLKGDRIYICSAFYSATPLKWLAQIISAREVVFAIRLDLDDPQPWFSGYIDPLALLQTVDSLASAGTKLTLFSDRLAHAKVYIGTHRALIGSANLTMRGFGCGPEIVTISGRSSLARSRSAADDYIRQLRSLQVADLRSFVDQHKSTALYNKISRQKENSDSEQEQDRLPAARVSTNEAFTGTYDDFINWLRGRRDEASLTILERALGKSNLQGHIDRNFHGLRQFFIARYDDIGRYSDEDPATYKVFKDQRMEMNLAEYVNENAVDEGRFSVDIWKSYLPIELGGRAENRGGTIGNLNRMVPLVAMYMSRQA